MENMKTKFRQIKDSWDQFKREEEINTDHKGRTKWIACCQISIFSSFLAFLIIAVYVATYMTPFIIEYKDPKSSDGMDADLHKQVEIPQSTRTAVVSSMWFVVVAGGLGIIIQLMASLSLWNSTEMGIEPIKALEKIRFWRNTTIVFTILDFFVWMIISQSCLVGAAISFIRLLALSHVSGFTKTLERDAAKQIHAKMASPLEIVTKK